MPKEPTSAVVKRRLSGVLFMVLVVALIGLSIAIYAKVFTKTVDVTLKANSTGNQLLKDSDVKIRGLIVGSVKDVKPDGDEASVELALMPEMVDKIPKNVSVQILPKTLFGEQYVSLILPEKKEAPIQEGDTISQDRTKGALEAQTVFDNLFPVLTAVRPADLNATLTAVSKALEGRGEKLGEMLVSANRYIKAINPSTQTLVDDLEKLGRVALQYDDVLPNIFDTLTNLQTTVRTVVQKQAQLNDLFTTGTDTAGTLYGFLDANRSRLITTVGQTAKIYPLLAEYSPSFPCLFQGINKLADGVNKTIYDNSFHLGATVNTSNLGKYENGDQPSLVTGLGPQCFGLPNNVKTDADGNFQIPGKYRCVNDGAALTDDPCAQRPSAATQRSLNSSEENALVNTLISGDMGTAPKQVPGISTVMAAPLLRGNTVVVK